MPINTTPQNTQSTQIYVYCYHPNKRFAYASYEDIPATPAEHHMTKYLVDVSSIPSNPEDKTFDGTTWSDITGISTERDLVALRKERNRLLAETDWWGMSDHTMTQAETDYRQALRDITDTYTSLDTVVWPTKP